jgi:Zn-dependent protease with chaperone function
MTRPSTRWIAWRVAIALVLLAGFYGLALAMIAGLLYLPYLEWRVLHRVDLRVLVFLVVGAYLILKAIVPRPDRFEAPGPRLLPAAQPRLFAELGRVASAVGQPMAAEVYLIPDVNAWVAQRGGFMGFGSRRVMGVGLLLLETLRLSELRAVIAHEFGHYHGGDTRIGPWVYKTREAIGRTLQALAGHSSLLQKPFDWYGRLFLRVTLAVSRQQERQADALAASIAGAPALAAGLIAIHDAGLAFPSYWFGEVGAVVGAGVYPPLASGFSRFIEAPEVAEALRKAAEEERQNPRVDPYDSHPSLRERLEALGASDPVTRAAEGPALALLDDVPGLERELLAPLAGNEKAAGLARVSWEETGTRVYVPKWRQFIDRHGRALTGVTPSALPTLDWKELGVRVLRTTGSDWAGADVLPAAEYAVSAAVALALVERGYSVTSHPGHSIRLEKPPDSLDLARLRERILSEPHEWTAFCARVGIAEVDLGRAGASTTT